MISFYDKLTGKTIDLKTTEINLLKWTEQGIKIIDIQRNEYLTKIIETQ